jgi:hypothetical protein
MINNEINLKLTYKEAILLQKMIMTSRVDKDEEVLAYQLLNRLVGLLEQKP